MKDVDISGWPLSISKTYILYVSILINTVDLPHFLGCQRSSIYEVIVQHKCRFVSCLLLPSAYVASYIQISLSTPAVHHQNGLDCNCRQIYMSPFQSTCLKCNVILLLYYNLKLREISVENSFRPVVRGYTFYDMAT